jgi:hypothetical protein
MARDRGEMQALVSVVLNLRVFAVRKLILYEIRKRVTTSKVTQPQRISASCPRHTQYVRVQGLRVTFLLGAVRCYFAEPCSFGSTSLKTI